MDLTHHLPLTLPNLRAVLVQLARDGLDAHEDVPRNLSRSVRPVVVPVLGAEERAGADPPKVDARGAEPGERDLVVLAEDGLDQLELLEPRERLLVPGGDVLGGTLGEVHAAVGAVASRLHHGELMVLVPFPLPLRAAALPLLGGGRWRRGQVDLGNRHRRLRGRRRGLDLWRRRLLTRLVLGEGNVRGWRRRRRWGRGSRLHDRRRVLLHVRDRPLRRLLRVRQGRGRLG